MKNKKIIIIVATILVISLLSITIFFLYSKSNKEIEKNNSNKKEEKGINNLIKEDKNIKKMVNFVNTFNNDVYGIDLIYKVKLNEMVTYDNIYLATRIGNSIIANDLYNSNSNLEKISKDNFSYDDFNKLIERFEYLKQDYRLNDVGYNKFIEKSGASIFKISEEKVIDAYSNYFKSDSYARSDFSVGYDCFYWSNTSNSYIHVILKSDTIDNSSRFNVEVTNIEKENNYINIYQSLYFAEFKKEEATTYYYNDIDKTKLLDKKPDSFLEKKKEFINKYKDELSLYKFRFIKDNNNYILESIERVR